jgi:hypothetical protein
MLMRSESGSAFIPAIRAPRRLLSVPLFCVLAALGVTSIAAPSVAQDSLPAWAPKAPPRIVEDRFRVEVSLFNAGFDTNLRIDASLTEPGTLINAEDDLKLDDVQLLAQGELTLLPGKHHLVRLSGFSTRRSAQAVLDKEIAFDNEVYVVNELVDSELNLTMVGLTYGYRFIVRERGELTGTFGIQIADVEANAVVRSRVVREAESGVAPLPLAGLEGRFDFTPHFSVEARVQYLTANISDVDGSIVDTRMAFAWRVNPYLVFGLGYRHFKIEVDSRDDGTPGFVDMGISGPLLFARASL